MLLMEVSPVCLGLSYCLSSVISVLWPSDGCGKPLLHYRNPLIYHRGDAAVERLLRKGIMKQWNQDGVVFCSYRSVMVGKTEDVTDEVTFHKVG